MLLARHWKFALILGVSGSLLGCKTPASSMYGGPASSAGGQPAAVPPANAAATNPVTKAWNSTTAAFSSAFPPKPKISAADEAISLGSKPAKISANTHIATGRLLEGRGDLLKAQDEYEKAIKDEPTNLTALVSLARLHDRQKRPAEAIATYQKALQAHPKSALVQNDLGLCYARKRDLASAVAMLHKAVELEPTKPNYRNNLATVLVEAGRTDEALAQLQAIHAPAIAEYNLAFLLNHRGQTELARRHLMQAVQLDPSLTSAQEMLAQLDGGAVASPMNEIPGTQIGVSDPALSQPQFGSPALGAAPQTGSYAPPAQAYPPQNEIPAQSAEPVFHIGSEGIESSPADGPSLHQPTSHEYQAPRGAHSPTGFHLDDSGDDEVLVVTHLIYGTDKDPAPQPQELVDDEEELAEETAAAAPGEAAAEPENVKPVTKAPTLYPIVE